MSRSRTRFLTAISILLLSTSLLGASRKAKGKTDRPSKQYSIEQFMATTSVRGASFSPDETQILFSSNETGIFNVYRIPIRGGKPVTVTSGTNSTYAVSYFPHDDRVLYTRDQSGDENNHLYVRGKDGKERDLTPGDKLKAIFSGWSHDGKSFFVQSNERDPRYFDLYRYDTATYERSLFYEDRDGYDLGAIANDQQWIAFVKPNTTSDSDIYLYNIPRKEMKHLTPHSGSVNFQAQTFDPASKALYYLSDEEGEFTQARSYDLATGKSQLVEKAGWDVVETSFSHNGKYRVTTINADGSTVIKLSEAASGKSVPLPRLPEGDITAVKISDSETKMAFYANSDRSPSNLHVLELRTGKVTRLTDTLSKQVDPEDLVDAQVVRFKSFDGMSIPSIFFKPHQATAARKAPALVWVHGGPGDQTRRGYSSLIQYLVNHGYVILGINNRGSSGYGKTFFTADDQKHGREPLWDCVEAKKYLASLPYVNGDRIGIIGGSYGGYMVLAALAFKPEVFDVGIDIFGVANWVRTLESIPPYWESFRIALYKEIGDPTKDLAMLREISPLFHAEKIKRPLLVIQGANDPRVIKPESDDIVTAVRKNGTPVEYIVFSDEGHGFSKKENQIEAYQKTLAFLDLHLKGKRPAAASH